MAVFLLVGCLIVSVITNGVCLYFLSKNISIIRDQIEINSLVSRTIGNHENRIRHLEDNVW